MSHVETEKPWGVVDPNTQHQVWVGWTIVCRVIGTGWLTPDFSTVRDQVTRLFTRLSRGHAAELNVQESRPPRPDGTTRYVIEWHVEDNRHLNPDYQTYIQRTVTDFLTRGFGGMCRVTVQVQTSLLSGDAGDGRPRAQLLVLPSRVQTANILGMGSDV